MRKVFTLVIIYFDLETYSRQREPRFDDKIITIQYSEVGGKLKILKEWDKDEKTILSQFYEYLREKLETERTVMIIGFNLLLFDRDLLGLRLNFYGIDTLENIFETLKKAFWNDLRYCLLPFNNFSFKGLSEDKVAIKLRIRSPKHSNKAIGMFYDNGDYDKILEHIETEMKFLSDLSYKMRKDPVIVKNLLRQN